MKIFYNCDSCGAPIDSIEVDQVDEERLGFDCLTGEERQDLIKFDASTNSMYVQSLCDTCIEALGLAEESAVLQPSRYIH